MLLSNAMDFVILLQQASQILEQLFYFFVIYLVTKDLFLFQFLRDETVLFKIQEPAISSTLAAIASNLSCTLSVLGEYTFYKNMESQISLKEDSTKTNHQWPSILNYIKLLKIHLRLIKNKNRRNRKQTAVTNIIHRQRMV